MSYRIQVARLVDPNHQFKCEECFDTGNEGDIGFFIRCKNGCEDKHHEMVETDKWLHFAEIHHLVPRILNGELVLGTEFFPRKDN